jgi:site-specific recombinase XerD
MSTVKPDPASPLYDLATSFSRSLKTQRRSPNTITTYLYSIWDYDKFASRTGLPREVPQIRRSHIEAYLEDQLERNKPATAATRYASLARFFAWCVDEGEVAVSPMVKMHAPKIPDRPPMVLTTADVDAILAACDGQSFRQRRDRALLSFLADSGCRRTEVATMRVTDLDLDQQTATVTGKGDKQRTVVFSSRTAFALDRYLRTRDKHKAASLSNLWLGQHGALSVEGLAEVVARRSTRAGVYREIDGQQRPINPHTFRHTFADRFLTNGGNEGDLMTLGGWSDTTTMRRYGRSRRTERAVASALRMFGEPA